MSTRRRVRGIIQRAAAEFDAAWRAETRAERLRRDLGFAPRSKEQFAADVTARTKAGE